MSAQESISLAVEERDSEMEDKCKDTQEAKDKGNAEVVVGQTGTVEEKGGGGAEEVREVEVTQKMMGGKGTEGGTEREGTAEGRDTQGDETTKDAGKGRTVMGLSHELKERDDAFEQEVRKDTEKQKEEVGTGEKKGRESTQEDKCIIEKENERVEDTQEMRGIKEKDGGDTEGRKGGEGTQDAKEVDDTKESTRGNGIEEANSRESTVEGKEAKAGEGTLVDKGWRKIQEMRGDGQEQMSVENVDQELQEQKEHSEDEGGEKKEDSTGEKKEEEGDTAMEKGGEGTEKVKGGGAPEEWKRVGDTKWTDGGKRTEEVTRERGSKEEEGESTQEVRGGSKNQKGLQSADQGLQKQKVHSQGEGEERDGARGEEENEGRDAEMKKDGKSTEEVKDGSNTNEWELVSGTERENGRKNTEEGKKEEEWEGTGEKEIFQTVGGGSQEHTSVRSMNQKLKEEKKSSQEEQREREIAQDESWVVVNGQESTIGTSEDEMGTKIDDDRENEEEDTSSHTRTLKQTKGLNLRVGEQHSRSFTYAWMPFDGIARDIDWTELSMTEQKSAHILITSDEELSIENPPRTVAIIVVNKNDCYEFQEKTIAKCHKRTTPTVAVTKSDGENIMSWLSSGTKVEIQIEILPIMESDSPLEVAKPGANKESQAVAKPKPDTTESMSTSPRTEHVKVTGKQMQTMQTLQAIENGLQIRVDGKVQTFEITPAPSMNAIQDTGWVQLLISPSDKKHILCKNMPATPQSALTFLKDASESQFTAAVVIINIHAISLADWSCFGDQEMPCIPLFIVTSTVGHSIMAVVKKNHSIEARIEGAKVTPVPKRKHGSVISHNTKDPPVISRGSSVMCHKNEEPHVISNGDSVIFYKENRPHVIQNGLLILPPLPKKKEYLPYAWLPVSNEAKCLKETMICDYDASFCHVRVCKTKPDVDLAEVVALEGINDDVHMEMLLVINHNNTYTVPNLPSEKWAWPVAIVTADSGMRLNRILCQHPDDTKVNVLLVSSQDTPSNPMQLKDPKLEQPGPTERFRQRTTQIPQSAQLLQRVRGILCDKHGHQIAMLENEAIFQMMMSEFNSHEEQGNPAADFNHVLIYLKENCHHTFKSDFPFYFAIAHRIHHLKRDSYEENFAGVLFYKCIAHYSEMQVVDMVTTLRAFCNREDIRFLIRITKKTKTIEASMFRFLENTMSRTLKEEMLPLYSTMILVITYYFFNAITGSVTKEAWKLYFTARAEKFVLTPENVDKMLQAMSFMEALQLPDKCSLTTADIGDFLIPQGNIRPFGHVRNVLHSLRDCFNSETEFHEEVVERLRNAYRMWISRRKSDYIAKLSPDRPERVTAIKQGLELLDEVLCLVQDKKTWHQETNWQKEYENWLHLLLQLIDVIHHPNPEILFDIFIHGDYSVCRRHKDYICLEVNHLLKRHLAVLPVQKFCVLYSNFDIWPDEIWKMYLKSVPVSAPAVPKSIHQWQPLFTAIVRRHPYAREHCELLTFCFYLAKQPHYSHEPVVFVTDLLNIRIPSLMAVEINKDGPHNKDDQKCVVLLQSMTEDFIRSHNLLEKIMKKMAYILDIILCEDKFQAILLEVIKKKIIPMPQELHQMKINTKTLVQLLADTLSKEHNWIVSKPTPKQAFALELLVLFCRHVTISDSLDRICRYSSSLHLLGGVYRTCDKKYRNEVMDGSIPDQIEKNPCHFVKEYFKWVLSLCCLLNRWKSNHAASYENLLSYDSYHSSIEVLAKAIAAERLVVSGTDIRKKKEGYLGGFESLNIALIWYTSEKLECSWCSTVTLLSELGVSFPPNILNTISDHFLYPSEAQAENIATPSTLGFKTFHPPQSIRLKFKKALPLCQLEELVNGIKTYLAPVSDDFPLLVYFHFHPNTVFTTHMTHAIAGVQQSRPFESTKETETKAVSVVQLHNAVKNVREILIKTFGGKATYKDITVGGKLDLENMDVNDELLVLANSPIFCGKNAEGLNRIGNLLSVLKYLQLVKVISQVCLQYDLQKCSKHSDLRWLSDRAHELENEDKRGSLTPNDATVLLGQIKDHLHMKDLEVLGIFPAISDSVEFYQFLKENKFTGVEGYVFFKTQFALVKDQLQSEDYNDTVLNHLFVAFEFISPFLKPKQNFPDLMKAVSQLQPKNGLTQLDTVRKNMHIIHLWFSRAGGDTIENVSNELKSIMENGEYCLHFGAHREGRLILRYCPNVVPQKLPGEQVSEDFVKCEPQSVTESWGKSKIENFVQKLGFLDSFQSDGKESMQQAFRHITDCAYRLLEILSSLRELGHPEYCHNDYRHVIKCQENEESAKSKVSFHREALNVWESRLDSLYEEHVWLLFYRVPKLMALYHHIQQGTKDGILRETTFLFKQDTSSQTQLSDTIERILPQFHVVENTSPIVVAAKFLDELFLCTSKSVIQLPQRYSYSPPPLSINSCKDISSTLHIALGFTQTEIILLILSIYNGLPEAFEVLHCTTHTTKQDIKLFMKRVMITKHARKYLVLEVDILPFHLQEFLLRLYLGFKHHSATSCSALHFVETGPSVFDEISPCLKAVKYKKEESFKLTTKKAKDIFQKCSTCTTVLVYGSPGIGKTHFICKEKLTEIAPEFQVTIPINEAFSTAYAIEKLCVLPYVTENIKSAVFFNFTMLQPVNLTHEREQKQYNNLMKEIGWFFFKLLALGYVEDYHTGHSFHLPQSTAFTIYIEVPSSDTDIQPRSTLESFWEIVPTLRFVGTPLLVDENYKYKIDGEAQLVCKYLQALQSGCIDKLYEEDKPLIKFSTGQDLSLEKCERLLDHYMPQHAKENKVTQRTFIRYMARRCRFLDNLPNFNYNMGRGELLEGQRTDTRKLGSTLLNTMLKEVAEFCQPCTREGWTQRAHQQLIYDFKDKGGSIGLITLHPDEIPREDKQLFENMGIRIPSMREMFSRCQLDQYLSRSLNVPLEKNEKGGSRLVLIDKNNYVLTLDFALKMLNIHERYECGVPAILEGETGVGKTALVKMLSELWNYAWESEWNLRLSRIVDLLKNKVEGIRTTPAHPKCNEVMKLLISHKCPSEEEFKAVACLPHENMPFFQLLNNDNSICTLVEDPMLAMLDFKLHEDENINAVFASASSSAQATAHLLYVIFSAEVKTIFYKLNVHEALKPCDIVDFFTPIFQQAKALQSAFDKLPPEKRSNTRVPFVTAYLDEINTASCLGLFKEIIVDRTILGKDMPKNIFVIASCNPHRGDVLALLDKQERAKQTKDFWLKGTYYVRKMHPTLHFLIWDYGSLNEHEERAYINEKMAMLSGEMDSDDVSALSELIVQSQCKMREYAWEELCSMGVPRMRAKSCATSCVSQRDIQRVFVFYKWLKKSYSHLEQTQAERRAVLVSLGIVYFMRLTASHRMKYRHFLDNHERLESEIKFSKAYKDELGRWIEEMILPSGISKATPLKENILAIIACTVNHIPLVIVGAPGSSKTLSFNVAVANLKGQESKRTVFRDPELFHSLEPYFYQCSRRTSSKEIDKIFERAIQRQRSLAKSQLPVYCVVFMDEAGLPEDKYESLKALHYHLDKQEVSFVAISNHVLDAAKTNRAVSLIRPNSTPMDLHELAMECIRKPKKMQPEQDKETVTGLGDAYLQIIGDPEFSQLYGLRDFIYFIIYLRRKRVENVTAQLIVQGLERCFNGTDRFQEICTTFLEKQKLPETSRRCLTYRSMLSILKASVSDMELSKKDDVHRSIQSEVRYKLIIDPSADESLVRLLFTFGVLRRQNTKVYICSEFPSDRHSRVNTIAQLRHSVAAGHTVLLSQTDEIHESFYDLFNQRFRSIEMPKEENKTPEYRYYANIAIGAHSKPCRVNPKFQCVVVVNKEELLKTPAPFLNRFEKYLLSHQSLMHSTIQALPRCVQIVLRAVQAKVTEFIDLMASDGPTPREKKSYSLYGFTEATLDSLILSILPKEGDGYEHLTVDQFTESQDIKQHILLTLIQALRENAKFSIEAITPEEAQDDACAIFEMVLLDPEYEKELDRIQRDEEQEKVAVRDAVDEALHVLYHAPGPGEEKPYDVYVEGCMVISVLVQWLVIYLCKRLMQLMTPEALVYYSKEIPHTYQRHYLKYQQHFSIQELVRMQLDKLEKNDWNSCVCATKLLCFTRSSSLIQQLPSEYCPSSSVMDDTTWMQKYVHPELEEMMILKITLAHSQNYLETYLSKFVQSSAILLLLIVRMPELSRKMVNHLRIMIEEAENNNIQHKKLFVLLIHFPSTSFFDPCYPSLFLQGWDHYYMDSVGHGMLNADGTVTELLAVKQWFTACCFPSEYFDSTKVQMYQTLQGMVEEAIPYVAARMPVPIKKCGSFNRPMNVVERREAVKCVLIDLKFGVQLADVYCTYWSTEKISELIRRSTRFTQMKKSTLNLTDSIQSTFKSLFFDFLVYMLNQFNEDCSLDILFEEHESTSQASDVMLQLSCSLLGVLPKPDLSQLPTLCDRLINQAVRPSSRAPKFPLFSKVCKTMENAVSACRKSEVFSSITIAQHSLQAAGNDLIHNKIEENMSEIVLSFLENTDHEGKFDLLTLTMKHMQLDTSNSLWDRYCQDFLHHKLHIRSDNALTARVLEAYVRTVDRGSSSSCMVSLHVHIEKHRLRLPQLVQVLRPISKLEKEDLEATMHLNKSETALTHLLPVTSVGAPLFSSKEGFTPDVYTLIVFLLFQFLHGCTVAIGQKTLNVREVKKWCASYHEIMLMPGVLNGIMKNLTAETEEETKLNIMHVTYLTVECSAGQKSAVGLKVFNELYTEYFGEAKKGHCPRLKECIRHARGWMDTADIDSKAYFEGLLEHFFSDHRLFFNEADCKWFLAFSNQSDATSDINLFHTSVSSNVLRYYLSKVLGTGADEPPRCFLPERRKAVGITLINASRHSQPGPYVPPFYRQRGHLNVTTPPQMSDLMQQPLADLYFLTVLEQLQNRNCNNTVTPNYLVRSVKKMAKEEALPQEEIALRSIEKQAVIQMLLQQTAYYIKSSRKAQDLFTTQVIHGINAILCDESMGGSQIKRSCHGLVLALHLKLQMNSTERLLHMLQDNEGTLVRTVHGMKFLQPLIETRPISDHHLLPFVGREKHSELNQLYQKLFQLMDDIHKEQSAKSIKELVQLAKSWCSDKKKIQLSHAKGAGYVRKKQAFKMIVWLCVYHKFFRGSERENKYSKYLADVFRDELGELLGQDTVYLLQSFLHPTHCMIKIPEAPMIMDENAERFQLKGNSFVPIQQEGQRRDPIFELFNPPKGVKQDPADQELCDALANMVAAVLACQPRSNHLWYHMFAADELFQTYITGFLYNDKVQEGRTYDCGVEIAADGTYGRPDYITRANCGSFSLHSLYVLLWCNFGAFCMALLTQPDAEEKISGKIIAQMNPIRHYCVSQLRSLWLHMAYNMKITSEERLYFITRCMYSLIQISSEEPAVLVKGVFHSSEELEAYEKMWHDRVYYPNSVNIPDQYKSYYKAWQPPLLNDLRYLEEQYPIFPTTEDFRQSILSSADFGKTARHHLYILSQLALQLPRLEAAGALLPNLIKFYYWLHTEGAYKVEKEYALNNGLEELITKGDEKYPEMELKSIYEHMRIAYNKYVTVVGRSVGAGACANLKRQNKLYEITDETPIISLLSVEDDPEQGYDWLYTVMRDIVDFHNHLMEEFTRALPHAQMQYVLPDSQSSILPLEVDEHACIIPPSSNLRSSIQLQLIRSRCVVSRDGSTFNFDFESLQKDMVATFILGKSKISTENLRKPFKFRQKKPDDLKLDMSVLDLSTIDHYMSADLKVELDHAQLKELECEFHQLDYHKMMKLVTGLRMAVEHLIKAVHLPDNAQDQRQLIQHTLKNFLQVTYKGKMTTQGEENDIMSFFGFHQLSQSQLQWLNSCKLLNLYKTYEFFVTWVEDGMYDFYHLPFLMKKNLSESQRAAIQRIPNESPFKDDPVGLAEEIQAFEEILLHNEDNLKKDISATEVSLIQQLEQLHFISESDQLPQFIPADVMCQQYVATRIALRRLLATVQQGSSSRSRKKWSDYVEDLWRENKLKHLRDVAIPYEKEAPIFAYDPTTGLFGYEEGYEEEEYGENEDFVFTHTGPPLEAGEVSLSTALQPPTSTNGKHVSAPSPPQRQKSYERQVSEHTQPVAENDLKEVAASMDVAKYLQHLKLEKYTEVFEEEGVTGKLLWEMCHAEEDELKDLGIENAFHRRKIKGKLEDYLINLQ